MEILTRAGCEQDRSKQLQQADKDRVSHDALKQRTMTLQGWTVMVVTDSELEADDGPSRVATQVRSAYDHLRSGTATPTVDEDWVAPPSTSRPDPR